MRIVNLIENTEGKEGCIYAHGLSFYIETEKHKIIMDFGPSEDTMANAEKLGIDLSKVDVAVLSHGHYDHSGGIIPFSKINNTAAIYMQRRTTDDYYSLHGEEYRYIGIDKDIENLSQVKYVEGDYTIDDELSLFVIEKRVMAVPFTNKRLKVKRGSEYVQDDFCHEQALVIKADGKTVLLSGCAHNGIVNILQEFKRKYGTWPDAAISGFHLVKKKDYTDEEMKEIVDTAKELKNYKTVFYTCHCTGETAFDVMKEVMGDMLIYVHTGDEIDF
ncbi:MBL fold metallo-hydrolase [Butyrivibrio sp. LC3010]|uniref:MBL fold metallo-hydrolase n=1 Tax=Butyrivibrio sp. LC3010 TaxID=1280680 RepID=UPI000419859B|nr:MBL fold metallo-hydrolase [Butyrivibrio sp. LC3010]